MMREDRLVQEWLSQLREERLAIAELAARAGLGPDRPCDIHLCYGDEPDFAFKGFLVTRRGDLDQLVAYRPVAATRSIVQRGAELRRAFAAIVAAASDPDQDPRLPGLLWLGSAGDATEHPMPGWVYGLRCVPLGGDWDGEFHTPRPFCPVLFERMAAQPQGARWLRDHPLSAVATAGGSEGPPSAVP